MFSLIITVVAIALVVLLILATIYFGGSAFGKGSAKVAAQTLVNQSMQIASARDIGIAQGLVLTSGQVVTLPVELLKQIPVPPAAAYATGTPAASDWEYYLPGVAQHFGLNAKIKKDVCMELNKSQGFTGIPAVWDGVAKIQCFGTGTAGYTLLYRPSNETPQQHTAVITKAVDTAKPSSPSAKPGYPRLCPDDTTIEDGVCPGSTVTTPPSGPVTPPVSADKVGFWVISAGVATIDGGWLKFGLPQIDNLGFSASCPSGAVNPNGPSATPLPAPAGEPYNADGVARMGWELYQDAPYPFTEELRRTWCIPAKQSEVRSGALTTDTISGTVGALAVTANTGLDPIGNDSINSAVQISANGVTWSILASAYKAGAYTLDPYVRRLMDGQKIAIGKAANAGTSYVPPAPAASRDGFTFGTTAGTITFTPPAPL